MERIYFDHSATTPIHAEVLGAMMSLFANHFGNPSSSHYEGRFARKAIEAARRQVSALIGADPSEIVFTGGGTEADNLAVLGSAFAQRDGKKHLIASAIEHPAVELACRHLAELGFAVTFLPVDGEGRVHPDEVRRAITGQTFLITVMHANNEVGTIQPLREIGAIARERGIRFHTDAVQSIGKIPVAVADLRVDLLSIAGHKIYGPKGTGALYVRNGATLLPIRFGGHQERALRSGTENVPGIVGLGKACEITLRDLKTQRTHLQKLRDGLETRIRAEISDIRINGHPSERLPHLSSVSFAGVSGEVLVRALDLRGIAVSSGSACAAGQTGISPVLAALCVPKEFAAGTVRFSFGRDNTEEELDRAVPILKALVERQRVSP